MHQSATSTEDKLHHCLIAATAIKHLDNMTRTKTRKAKDLPKGKPTKKHKATNKDDDEDSNQSGTDSDNDNNDTHMETEQPNMALNLDRLEKMLTERIDSMFKAKMKEMVEKQQVAEEEKTKDSEKMKAQGYLNKPEDLSDNKNLDKMEA